MPTSNSPVEIGDTQIRFTDFELDVSRELPGAARIVDEDEFQAAASRYGYSPELRQTCYRVAREALAVADGWVGGETPEWKLAGLAIRGERSDMTCPICAWSPDSVAYRFLFETTCWRVVLAPNQSLVGRCVVHLKRHAGDLADLTHDELADWLQVVRSLEGALRSAFGATMFNWSCYMNHAYREPAPEPHIHWWAVPRYDHPVDVGDWTFTDPEFGSPYHHGRWLEVPEDIHREIADRIRQRIENRTN